MSADQTRSAELRALADGLEPLCDDFRLAGEKRAAAIKAQSTLRTYAAHHEAVEASGLREAMAAELRCQMGDAQTGLDDMLDAIAYAHADALLPLIVAHLAEREAGLIEALSKIAVLDDESANRKLAATGSYSGFDEPHSTQIARAALRARQPAQDGSADRGRG